MENSEDVNIPKGLIPAGLLVSGLAIAFLFWIIYGRETTQTLDVGWLSALNAGLNACSATALFLGYRAVRRGQLTTHRNFMLAALALSSAFLISYIIYHTFHGDSKFLGTGVVKGIYLFILATHVIGSMVALPMILVTVGLAFSKRFPVHQKWARKTFPLWAYVSVTGVMVFAMLRIFGHT